MVMCSMVAAAKTVKIPRFPDVHTTALGGSLGLKVFPSTQTWLLDEHGKMTVERIISYVASRSR
jgi:hypothetical protein